MSEKVLNEIFLIIHYMLFSFTKLKFNYLKQSTIEIIYCQSKKMHTKF